MYPASTQQTREYQDERGAYVLPKDSPEHDRLDAQSASLVALMDYRPFHAPLSRPKRILDIGCGTEGMTNMLASIYPDAHVIGIDIAPVPESRHEKHENVEYIQGDIRELLGKDRRLELGSFDYLFQRMLLYGITEWEAYLKSISGLLRPGGWLEIQEGCSQLYSEEGDRILENERFYSKFRSGGAALGLDVEVGVKMKQLLGATPGLVDVRESVYKCAPVARKEAPELEGLEAQIKSLFTFFIRKFDNARGSDEAYTEQLVEEVNVRFEKGFEGGDRHRITVVVGQRATS